MKFIDEARIRTLASEVKLKDHDETSHRISILWGDRYADESRYARSYGF